ncbi:UNVERIFIED_CONTAM: hypothetical protein FKN15_033522 [Acipenser sinensis]
MGVAMVGAPLPSEWEEPECQQPEWEEPECQQPEWEEPERPQPEREESVRPVSGGEERKALLLLLLLHPVLGFRAPLNEVSYQKRSSLLLHGSFSF